MRFTGPTSHIGWPHGEPDAHLTPEPETRGPPALPTCPRPARPTCASRRTGQVDEANSVLGIALLAVGLATRAEVLAEVQERAVRRGRRPGHPGAFPEPAWAPCGAASRASTSWRRGATPSATPCRPGVVHPAGGGLGAAHLPSRAHVVRRAGRPARAAAEAYGLGEQGTGRAGGVNPLAFDLPEPAVRPAVHPDPRRRRRRGRCAVGAGQGPAPGRRPRRTGSGRAWRRSARGSGYTRVRVAGLPPRSSCGRRSGGRGPWRAPCPRAAGPVSATIWPPNRSRASGGSGSRTTATTSGSGCRRHAWPEGEAERAEPFEPIARVAGRADIQPSRGPGWSERAERSKPRPPNDGRRGRTRSPSAGAARRAPPGRAEAHRVAPRPGHGPPWPSGTLHQCRSAGLPGPPAPPRSHDRSDGGWSRRSDPPPSALVASANSRSASDKVISCAILAYPLSNATLFSKTDRKPP